MSVPGVAFSASELMGPVGGLVGLAFAAGATAGWNFAVRTVLKLTTKRFDDLKETTTAEQQKCEVRVAALEQEMKALRDQYTDGLERQLQQVRESTIRMMSEGQIKNVG